MGGNVCLCQPDIVVREPPVAQRGLAGHSLSRHHPAVREGELVGAPAPPASFSRAEIPARPASTDDVRRNLHRHVQLVVINVVQAGDADRGRPDIFRRLNRIARPDRLIQVRRSFELVLTSSARGNGCCGDAGPTSTIKGKVKT